MTAPGPVRTKLPPRRRLLFAAVLMLGLGGVWPQDGAAEYRVKAAFLYKFLSFIEWPAQAFAAADSPVVIGVLGADVLAAELEALLADRLWSGHPVTPRRLRPGESLAGLHVLFVGRAEAGRASAALAAARGQTLLTVSESDEAFASGSAINFVIVDNKVRFDVALRPAEQNNLKISSRLLSVARKVVPGAS